EYWFRGTWVDDLEVYWHDLNSLGHFLNRSYAGRDETPGKNDTGLLAVHFTLPPGKKKKTIFAISWHIPNRKNNWNKNADKMAEENGIANSWKNWYATRWRNSQVSGKYLIDNYHRLRNDTFKFHDALFASTLPEVVLDGVSANLAVLRNPTCLRLEDGTFYGWEGVGTKDGSCEGSCTHVWNYAQALPFLFPELERSMREANYRFSVDEDGGSHFRIMLPLGIKADTDFMRPCVDGQFGDVMKTYRDWKISGDNDWLRKLWPTIRKTMEYAWSDKNYDRWDPEQSGIISGRQHHTLDMELFGPSAWLNGHYLGALKAAAEMADMNGDNEFAATCREIFAKGKKWTDANLFNGEYYCQQLDLKDKKLLESFSRNGEDQAVEKYWDAEHQEIKYQIGEGCGIDMHLPQWYASLYGLGEILDPAHTLSTLQAIYKYNYKKNMRNVVNTWRNYALNDEGGVQICSWPDRVRKPVIPIPYASETMHGFEWAAACHMIMNGMLEEGMEIVRSIRNRYDGEKRNPWNEIECGSNYARSMASYALLNAFCGFRFDLTRNMIGFFPLMQAEKFRCFWSLGSAWGEFIRSGAVDSIKVAHGHLKLRELQLAPGVEVIEANGKTLDFKAGEGVLILHETISLNSEDAILLRR
ncbi:MAG: GH116 family glycosyl hydrolase, partial [Victivallales bacterium]|nr:GH116 family glycosyl hydrolase [Victivallales bacterium]